MAGSRTAGRLCVPFYNILLIALCGSIVHDSLHVCWLESKMDLEEVYSSNRARKFVGMGICNIASALSLNRAIMLTTESSLYFGTSSVPALFDLKVFSL